MFLWRFVSFIPARNISWDQSGQIKCWTLVWSTGLGLEGELAAYPRHWLQSRQNENLVRTTCRACSLLQLLTPDLKLLETRGATREPLQRYLDTGLTPSLLGKILGDDAGLWIVWSQLNYFHRQLLDGRALGKWETVISCSKRGTGWVSPIL